MPRDPSRPEDRLPDVYPRLAYRDELAAIDWICRVFQFTEEPDTRFTHDGVTLAWLRLGSGIVMVGRENAEVHRIHSPQDGRASAQVMVRVDDIDSHHAHAVAGGATVTLPLEDTPFGLRRYEASDPEGQRWSFYQPLREFA